VARRHHDKVTWTSVADNYDAAHTSIGSENINKILRQLQASFGI
jgi:isopentenyldiphosphate isomerase